MKTKLFILLSIFCLTISAIGQDVNDAGYNKLSAAQKAKIMASIEAEAKANQAATIPDKETVEKLDAWVDLGTKIGKGLSGAAKETGLAVNDFAKTPVGMLTTGIILWKFVGNMIYHFFAALVILGVGIPMVNYIFNRAHTTSHYDKDHNLVKAIRDDYSCDATIGYVVCHVAVFATAIIVMFTY